MSSAGDLWVGMLTSIHSLRLFPGQLSSGGTELRLPQKQTPQGGDPGPWLAEPLALLH